MSIEFIIDTREQELISKLSPIVKIKVEQLDIGDILFRQDQEVILLIERKTVNDLKASICDGRGREQKVRLLGTTPRQRIMYLIEGCLNKNLNDKISGLPVDTLVGSLINTQLRDGIHVYKTSTIDESVNFLQKLFDKLQKDGDKYFNDDEKTFSSSDYASSLKKNKKANMTPTVWFISQLCLIPQVTEKIAEEIVQLYPTVKDLLLEYEKTPESIRKKLLSDIKFSVKNDKQRRIGDKISGRIYEFLYGINKEDC